MGFATWRGDKIPCPEAERHSLRLHHVGCAVREIAPAVQRYREIYGFTNVSLPIHVPAQRANVCFVEVAPQIYVEFVEPAGPDSPVEGVLARTGGGLYHLCFEVEDLDLAIRELRSRGYSPISKFEASGNGPHRFVFLLDPDRQVLELCEKAPSAP
ncbi:MAG: VOC family protein [Planctomycetes bacterium]|nr:VOC family protein [Planctomycetota bacterium]